MEAYGCPYCKGQTSLSADKVLDSVEHVKLVVAGGGLGFVAEHEFLPFHREGQLVATFKAKYCPICGAELKEVQRYLELQRRM